MKQTITSALLVFSLIFLSQSVMAQVSAIPFSSSTQGYNEITGGTLLVSNATWDDDLFTANNIGFNFTYNGNIYNTFSLNDNGFIVPGNAILNSYGALCDAGVNPNVIAPLCGDLRSHTSLPSEIRYQTFGSSPNRTCVIQWKNATMYNTTVNVFNFQIILYETLNTIQFSYGPFTVTTTQNVATCGSGSTNSIGVGLSGTTVADFNVRRITIGTDTWPASAVGTTINDRCQLSAAVFPATGLTYTFGTVPPSMTYVSSTTTQISSGVPIFANTTNNQIIQIQVVTGGGPTNPLSVSSLNLGTNGSTNPVTDITNAKLYYTGLSSSFSTGTLYGTSVSPNGTFSVAGAQTIASGTNYFWLTYDVPVTAAPADLLDAQCNTITGSGSMGTVIPSVVAPAGNRPIAAPPQPLCGIKNIPGDYPTIAACISDLNTVGITCPTIINVAAGYTESNVNLTLSCPNNPPNSTNTLTFRKNGAGANPLLTAGTGVSATVDGMFIINGLSYVTIDGIDLQENVANVTALTQMEWGYAIVKKSTTVGSQHNTIQNCTITLNKANTLSTCIYTGNHTTGSTTALIIASFNGTSSYNHFYNNTCQNSYFGYQVQGYNAATPYDFFDQGNEIGTTGGGRSQVLNFGGSTVQTIGINAIYQNGMKIFNTNINGGTGTTSNVYGIFGQAGINSNLDIYGDTVTVVSASAASGTLAGIFNSIGTTGTGNTVNIYNNVVTNCTYPTNTAGTFYGIASTSVAAFTNMYGNKVTNNSIPGTGTTYLMYYAGTGANVIQTNLYNNIVSGNTHTGASGALYMFYASATTTQTNFYGNQLFNNSNATSSGLTYGYYNFGSGFGENVYNNQVYNCTGGTASEFVGLYTRDGASGTDKLIYGNSIYGLTGGNQVGAIYEDYATNLQMYNNNIYNISSTATALTPATYGIQVGTNINQNINIYNNFISELKAATNSSTNSIYGIWFVGLAATTAKIYYNTIYLNASSSATTFGTSAVLLNSTPFSVDLRNNILVNASTPGTTGRTIAIQRNTTTLTNYNTLSGNNCLFAGTPGASNVIYFDGTNADQTLQAFKDRMGTRDQASFTEIPPFVNIGASPYDLHIQTGIATQVEKGGQPVNITTDYDGITRSATFPDAGADEFTGTFTDNASPLITYTPLGIGSTGTSRTVTNFATISDPSGINTTAGTRPRIYYKKSTQTNTINDNTSGTDGWKWVEASNTSSPYSFNIDYTIIFGGSVAAADVIQYFVVAQDLNGTPRVGNNAAAFALQPTSVNLIAANTPIGTTNTNTYTITGSAPLSGTVTVGTLGGENYPSLTNAGGLFAAINTGSLSGNLVVNITSDMTAELGTNALNQWSETGVGGYTITIQPSSASVKTISGTVASALVRLDGASKVTIDGRFGGTGSYLLFRNLNVSNADLQFLNDAQNNLVRNCIFESANTSTVSGAIVIGTTTKANGNDNNIITYNEIRNRTDVVAYYAQGIYCAGTTTTLPQYNNNCIISNNNIHDFFVDGGVQQGGVTITTGNTGFNIDSNSVYQTATRTMTVTGALGFGIFVSNSATVASNGAFNIRKNYIGGSAPLCGGTPLTWTVSSTTQLLAFNGIRCVSGQIPNFITDNTVANLDLTANNTASNNFIFLGIGTGNGIWNIKRNTIGSPTGNDNIKITLNTGGAGLNIIRGVYMGHFTITAGWGGVIDSNSIGSFTVGGSTTVNGAYFEGFGAGGTSFLTNNLSMSYNTVGSTTTANSIRLTYATAVSNLRLMDCFAVSQTININANRFQNITDFSTGASTMWSLMNGTPGNVVHSITNNLWSDISSATTIGLGSTELLYLASTSPNEVISGNTMQNISLTNTGAFNSGLCGIITFTANTIGGTFSNNKIYNLNNLQTGVAPTIFGAYFNVGSDWNVTNNMIALTNGQPLDNKTQNMLKEDNKVNVPYVDHSVYSVIKGYEVPFNYTSEFEKTESPKEQVNSVEDVHVDFKSPKTDNNSSTNSAQIYGLYDVTNGGTKSIVYNTVYIGGSNTGAANNSYCFDKLGTGNIFLRNNLFYNNRTGLGSHYAIGNDAGTPTTGWPTNASNYNAFVSQDSNVVGSWGTVAKSIDAWRTSSNSDFQTWSTKTSVIAPANLFTNVAAGDLHILSGNAEAWLVSGKGIGLTGYGNDFDAFARSTSISGGVTDIGADEFAATPPGNPIALQSAAPSSGGTTDYVIYGRKIATINWGTGGVYPTSMNVNYFSGVNPVNLGTFTPRYSNSYWTINPASGTFSGTTYDATIYFGDNETFNITSPNTNTILGKNDQASTTWFTYGPGVSNKQTELNWTALTAKVRGLNSFSNFALSDDAYPPSPLLLSPTNNSTAIPVNVTLTWNKSFGAGTYKVQVATDSLFTSPVINDSTVTDTTRIATGLVINTQYWWRVRGKNGTGIGLYSEIWKFNTTPALAPPPPPVLVSPPNNSTGQSITPLLVWNRSTAAATYRVQLATDAGFTNIILNDSTVTDSTRLAGTLAPLTNYWWRINAKNAAGTSAFSTVFTFKTIGPASGFTLINPPNNSTGQPINILFTWHKAIDQTLLSMGKDKGKENSDNVTVVSTYFYERVTDTVTLANRLVDSTLTDTTKNVVGLNYLTKYFWRVKAKNQIGYGPFTGWFNFTTTVQPAAVVNLTVIPGGFYNTGTGTLNMRDTVRVYLLDSATCVKMDSAKVVLDSVTFTASPNFNIANTGNYYIVVKHRNHIIVASRLKQTVTRGSTVAYNFVSDSSNTYANNVIKVSNSPVRWAMIPGDANQDQFVDGLDQTLWIIQNGSEGYFSTDFNGDGFVDGLDQTVWILFNGNSSFLPCAFPDYYINPNTKQHVVIDNRTTQKIFNNNSNQDAKKGNK